MNIVGVDALVLKPQAISIDNTSTNKSGAVRQKWLLSEYICNQKLIAKKN